jgi:hypothetical protein
MNDIPKYLTNLRFKEVTPSMIDNKLLRMQDSLRAFLRGIRLFLDKLKQAKEK